MFSRNTTDGQVKKEMLKVHTTAVSLFFPLPLALCVCLSLGLSLPVLSLSLSASFLSDRLSIPPDSILPSSTKGVAKYGDAWARLAQRHQETGVVVVDESDRDDNEEDADDNFSGGEQPCGDGEPSASAPAGGGEANEKRQSKAQDKGKQKKRGEKKNKRQGLGPSRPKTGLRWDEGEHQRFVEVRYVRRRTGDREMRRVQRHGSDHGVGGGGGSGDVRESMYTAANKVM